MVSYERSLFQWFVLAVVGWPAVGLALVLVAAGIVRRRPWWVAFGAVAATPFSLYIAAAYGLRGRSIVPVLALLALALAAWAVARGRTRLAWGLVVPFAVLAGWTGWAVWQSAIEWRRMDGIDATPGQNLLDRSAPYPQPLRSPDRP